MYKDEIRVSRCLFTISLVCSFTVQSFININYNNIASDVITLFSIICGFIKGYQFIFLPSKKAEELYLKEEYDNDGSKSNLLNRVLKYHDNFFKSAFTCIILCLIMKMLPFTKFPSIIYDIPISLTPSKIIGPFIASFLIKSLYILYLSEKIFLAIYRNNRA